jgi:hypothetical protein
MKLTNLVVAGKLTPACKSKLEALFTTPAAVECSIGKEDNFEALVAIMAENNVVGLREKTSAQLMSLPKQDADENPVMKDVLKRRKAAGLDK